MAKLGTLPPDAINVLTLHLLDLPPPSTSLLKHITLPPEENWYSDIGATHHLTSNLQNLNISSEEYSGQDQIQIGNGTGLSISHSGSTSLSLSRRQFLLKQLLHVPHICKNLLSVRQFALDNDVFFEFHSSFLLLRIARPSSQFIMTHLRMAFITSFHRQCIHLNHKHSLVRGLLHIVGTTVWDIQLFKRSTLFYQNFNFLFYPIRQQCPARSVHKQRVTNCPFQFLKLLFVIR